MDGMQLTMIDNRSESCKAISELRNASLPPVRRF